MGRLCERHVLVGLVAASAAGFFVGSIGTGSAATKKRLSLNALQSGMGRGYFVFKKAIAGVMAFGFVTSAAHAAVIDFTDPATAMETGSVLGVGWTLTSPTNPLGITFTPYDGVGLCPGSALYCSSAANGKDGAGVQDDEVTGASINSGERLQLTFAQPIVVTGFYFLDLFSRGPAPEQNSSEREEARVSFNDIDYLTHVFLANKNQIVGESPGYKEVSILPTIVGANGSVWFTAFFQNGRFYDDGTNDYSLAGVKVEAIPIPPAVLLFGTALIGMGFLARRRKQREGLKEGTNAT